MKRQSAQRLVWGVALAVAMVMGWPSSNALAAEFLKDVSTTGFVETQYINNLASPLGPTKYRVFDGEYTLPGGTTPAGGPGASSFTLNNAQLSFMKAPKTGAGFGLVLATGNDSKVTSSSNDNFDVWQAYISDTTMDGNLNLKFGKFATLTGAEVKEGISNYNVSRSFLFGYAIPFVHTGVRATFTTPVSGLTIIGGVNNGWSGVNSESENNQGKTGELSVGFAPSDMLSLAVTGLYGPEPTGPVDNDNRGLLDIVATFKPASNLAIVLNLDRTTQSKGSGNGTDLVQGYAVYVNFGIDDMTSVTVRGEMLDDQNGFATGLTGVGGGGTLREATLTLSHKHHGIEWRGEFRHDESNQDTYFDDTGALEDTQNTIAIAAYYPF